VSSIGRLGLDGVLEASNAFRKALSKLWQLLWAEQKEGDHENNEQVSGLEQVFDHKSSVFNSACEQPTVRMKFA
jgi:hypothetical protein